MTLPTITFQSLHNRSAEDQLVGFCLSGYDKDFIVRCQEIGLKAEHLSRPWLWNALTEASHRYGSATMRTLSDYFDSLPSDLPKMEPQQLAHMVENAPIMSSEALGLARIVLLASKREMVRTSMIQAYSKAMEAENPEEAFFANLTDLATSASVGETVTMADASFEFLDTVSQARRAPLPTSLQQVDSITRGLFKGEMSVWAAGPGTGKSAIAMQMMNRLYRQGGAVHFFSMEMSKENVVERHYQADAQVNFRDHYDPNDKQTNLKISKTLESLAKEPLRYRLTTTFGLNNTPTAVRLALLADRASGIMPDLIVIDFIQLFDADKKAKNADRVRELDIISRQFRDMAKEFNVHVLLLSQLSREGRKDKNGPDTLHLKESGGLEQNANMIFLMWTEPGQEFCLEKRINIKVAKNRGGQTGFTFATFTGHNQTFL